MTITITTLGDCRGRYSLQAVCDSCDHSVALDLEALIARLGADRPLREVSRRAKCSKCGAKAPDVRVQLVSDGRPDQGRPS